jgi:hypothetical protein
MPARRDKRVVRLSDCAPEAVEWLWPGRIAAAKVTLLDGDPSQGKSLLTLDLAARLTTARPLPDGPTLPAALSVVLVGTEDGLRDTVLPRLRAAGADLNRVHAFIGYAPNGAGNFPPQFPDDCDLLSDTLRETGARLVVIDPLAAVLGDAAGTLSGPLIRRALGPLGRVAEETRAAMILVRHLTKAGRSQRALYRGGGSIAIIGAARTAFLVGAHPEDDDLHVLACTKNILAEPPPALGFRIAANDGGEPVLTWTGAVDVGADELVLAPGRPHGEALRQACAFLKELLASGPCGADEAFRRGREAGFSKRTLERAKGELRVASDLSVTDKVKHWSWTLPPAEEPEDPLTWAEQQQRAVDKAQKENDALMARLREKYGNDPWPKASGP